jgi:hypothetical protein
LARNLWISTAATPPVEVAPAIIIAKLAKHAGHIRPPWSASVLPPLSQPKPHRAHYHSPKPPRNVPSVFILQLLSPSRFLASHRRLGPLAENRVRITPALPDSLVMLLLNQSQRRVMKLDPRHAAGDFLDCGFRRNRRST